MVLDDAEEAFGGRGDFARRVGLEAKHDFQEARRGRRPDGQEEKVAAGREHARQLAKPRPQRQVFEHAARHDEVERIRREGERERVGADVCDAVAQRGGELAHGAPRRLERAAREVYGGDLGRASEHSQQREREQPRAAAGVEYAPARRQRQARLAQVAFAVEPEPALNDRPEEPAQPVQHHPEQPGPRFLKS